MIMSHVYCLKTNSKITNVILFLLRILNFDFFIRRYKNVQTKNGTGHITTKDHEMNNEKIKNKVKNAS